MLWLIFLSVSLALSLCWGFTPLVPLSLSFWWYFLFPLGFQSLFISLFFYGLSLSQASYCHSCVFTVRCQWWVCWTVRPQPECVLACVCMFQDWYRAVPCRCLPTSQQLVWETKGARQREKHREPLCTNVFSPSFPPSVSPLLSLGLYCMFWYCYLTSTTIIWKWERNKYVQCLPYVCGRLGCVCLHLNLLFQML